MNYNFLMPVGHMLGLNLRYCVQRRAAINDAGTDVRIAIVIFVSSRE